MKLPDVIRTRLEQECEAGEKAGGMTVHDGRTKIHAADIRYLLGMIDAETNWIGCGECDLIFPCHEGMTRCCRIDADEESRRNA